MNDPLRVSVRSALSALVIASASLGPSLLLAHGDLRCSLEFATVLVVTSGLVRLALTRFAPARARGYVVARLCSPRYQLPAVALPLGSAAAIAGWANLGLAVALAAHLALAWRYRRRWQRPGALPRALPIALVAGFFVALERLALRGHEWRHGGRLLYAEESPLQRVVLVERRGSLDLFIDGELQFRSADERLYHDALVGPASTHLPEGARVLVMGGGDGLAARDLLRCPRVSQVTIVDWDPAVTRLFRDNPELSELNQGSLRDPRVVTLHRDVRAVFRDPGEPFDLVVGDLVDPSSENSDAAALYSTEFYRTVEARIAPGGLLVTHASSVNDGVARGVCDALSAARFRTESYVCEVPAFGAVSYVLARK